MLVCPCPLILLLLFTITTMACAQPQWSPVETPLDVRFDDIVFADETTGFIVGQSMSILTTTDAGQTWAISPVASVEPGFTRVQMPSSSVGFLLGSRSQAQVYGTTSNGQSWTPLLDDSIVVHGIRDISAPTTRTVNAVSGDGYIFRSDNGGAIWRTVYIRDRWSFDQVCFRDSLVGIVAGSAVGSTAAGLQLRTSDGGRTWAELYICPNQCSVEWVAHIANSRWIATSGMNILESTDDGLSWKMISTLPDASFGRLVRDILVIDPLEQFVLTETPGIVYHSTDGARTWEGEDVGVGRALRALAVNRSGAVFTVGDSGTVARRSRVTRVNNESGDVRATRSTVIMEGRIGFIRIQPSNVERILYFYDIVGRLIAPISIKPYASQVAIPTESLRSGLYILTSDQYSILLVFTN